MVPTSRFRMTWDALREIVPLRANKRYLEILELAAKEGDLLLAKKAGSCSLINRRKTGTNLLQILDLRSRVQSESRAGSGPKTEGDPLFLP